MIDDDDPLGPYTIHENDPRRERARKKKQQQQDKAYTNGNGAHAEAPPKLERADLRGAISAREWALPDRIPNENVALFYGDGAIGKSLMLLTLGVCYALNIDELKPRRDWLGALPHGGKVLYVSCEEDVDELKRRLEDIALFYGSTRDEISANMIVHSWVGEDSTLCIPARNGAATTMQMLPRFAALREEALSLGPRPLIILDTVADMFGGNENDRVQVRAFITQLRRLAIDTKGAVLMAAHPSVAGMATDSGTSGSTAWNNSVRARAYFKRAKDDDSGDMRVLEYRKSNYGPITETITLQYRNGVFVRHVVDPLDQAAADRRVENLFMELLFRLSAAGQDVSAKPSPTYAPTIFARQNEAKNTKPKVTKDAFEDAMRRLIDAKKIAIENSGPPSKPRSRIVPRVYENPE